MKFRLRSEYEGEHIMCSGTKMTDESQGTSARVGYTAELSYAMIKKKVVTSPSVASPREG